MGRSVAGGPLLLHGGFDQHNTNSKNLMPRNWTRMCCVQGIPGVGLMETQEGVLSLPLLSGMGESTEHRKRSPPAGDLGRVP